MIDKNLIDDGSIVESILREKYFRKKKFYEDDGMKKYFQDIRKNYKYLCIFGAGIWGIFLGKWLSGYDVKVDYYCDNDKKKVGSIVNDAKVLSFEELVLIKNEVFVIVSATNKERHYNEEINQQIIDFPYIIPNILKIAAFFRDDYQLSFENCLSSAKQFYFALSDERSKELFLELLKVKFVSSAEAFAQNPLEKFYDPVQYFAPCHYKNSKDAIIVDCGAFVGDSLLEYLDLFHNDFKEYHCFEMDPNVLPILKSNIDTLPEICKKKVYVHPCGVSDEEGYARLHLSTDTGGSSFQENGECEVAISLLDQQMRHKNVTMIKMDIEGAELKALIGASELIKKNRPILAISIYHSMEQFFEIPVWILEHYPFYKMQLGLHTTITDDTVLYAIPDNMPDI